ncbi:MAG: nuclear transport factor 2 family protein [Bacteroidetes bacterium]|nr:nuclear transport factor 2 family protein [Bacteroidota bacterium]
MNNIDLTKAFIDRINTHDVNGLIQMMSEDHTFIDSIGSVVHGRKELERAWTGYFRLFPDYKITVKDIFGEGNKVAVFGTAAATYSPSGHLYPDHHWEIPAAWEAQVHNRLISHWAIFADNYKTVQMIQGLDPKPS